MYEKRLSDFAELIRNSSNIVFFGGAGVSTESGMKDYRSEDGLYNTVKKYSVSPETILSHSFFMEQPDVFYDFYYNYFLNTNVEPNKAHYALAELEKRGKLKAVITQNVDGLHQRAGSKNVIELHGSILEHYCSHCKAPVSNELVKDRKGKVPVCPQCSGVVRPNVVLYEEPLSEKTANLALGAILEADMLIIGGTSLAVYPAADYLRYFIGDKVVLINRDVTPYDSKATLVFRESIGDVLSKTISIL